MIKIETFDDDIIRAVFGHEAAELVRIKPSSVAQCGLKALAAGVLNGGNVPPGCVGKQNYCGNLLR